MEGYFRVSFPCSTNHYLSMQSKPFGNMKFWTMMEEPAFPTEINSPYVMTASCA
jgi:hypothetical protein